ncbi:MAG: hypothetical protein GX556_11095 [Fibrobacter sp.]|nr:hypothetical protein [Fibrobacter sp.]
MVINFNLADRPFLCSTAFFFLIFLFISTTSYSDTTTAVTTTSAPSVPQISESSQGSFLTDWNFRPGDAIIITVTPDTGFPNGIYPVDGQGYVDLPMIGPLQVTKMGRASFEKKIGETWIPLLRFSSIQARRVISLTFQGGFNRPGTYWVSPGATLWRALSQTGGTVREDGIEKIKWKRGAQKMTPEFTELLTQTKPIAELGFQSGDILEVINRPKRTGWDIFKQDILPVVSFGLSSAVTAITLYEWSQKD